MTTDTITSHRYSVYLQNGGAYGDPVTIASGVHVEQVTAFDTWTIDNHGSIGGSYHYHAAVALLQGGTLINEAGGVISGYYAGLVGNGTNTIDNSGLIVGSADYGVLLIGDAAVTNASTGTIIGHGPSAALGIYRGSFATVENAGSISSDGKAVYLGGSIANRLILDAGASFNGSVAALATAANTIELTSGAATGTLAGVGTEYIGFQTITIDHGASWNIGAISVAETVINAGTVGGIELDAGGAVTNQAGATISSAGTGIIAQSPSTVDNLGLIQGGSAGAGVYLYGTLTNASTGTITGEKYGVTGTASLVNAGTIQGTGTNGVGVELHNAASVTNAASGHILGTHIGLYEHGDGTIHNAGLIGGSAGFGVQLGNGGTIVNQAGATITGLTGVSALYGAIDNSGIITGTGTAFGSAGVNIFKGTVTNEAGGTISAAGYYGVTMYRSTLVNAGTIENSFSQGAGVFFNGGGALTNAAGALITGHRGIATNGFGTIDNFGTITGAQYGIVLNGGGVVLNAAGGTIAGIEGGHLTLTNAGAIGANSNGIALLAGDATVVNTGVISGGTGGAAVLYGHNDVVENRGTIVGNLYFEGSQTNRLILGVGSVFEGTAIAFASTGGSTIELVASAAATGTLSGLGSQFSGFHTVTIDSNAAWDIGGAISGFYGVAIDGFNNHDRLDLTNLAYAAGGTATLNGSNKLVISEGGTAVATIQLDASVTGEMFKLVDDGHGGTYVEENDYAAACYLRGTRIRTPTGERPVEDLRIGDLIAIAGGGALPLKWIGRRSYREWLAVGNADVQPVLFKAGSLAARVPARDLYVSPEHAMFLDGMLIPACHLVNGVSILKTEGMEDVEYFHLEFERHAVIFAEGATAESFVDDDSRMLFHNAEEYRRLYPDEPLRAPAEFCAPRVDAGPALATLQRALAARAARLRPDGKLDAAPARRGYLDRATRSELNGWAAGEGGPAALAIVVNGAVIGRTLADGHRPDLAAAGVGDCGFRFVLPQALSPELGHRIEVRRESDWSLLAGAPVTLSPSKAVPAG